MATVVSTPVAAWVASILAGGAVNQSSSLTITVNITAGWEVQLPIACRFSNVSADPIINVYPSMDGGTTYDSTAFASFAIARVSTGTGQASIRLSQGQYVLQLLNSGPNTATFFAYTQLVVTAIQNV